MALVTACAPGNLGHLGWNQSPLTLAVELGEPGKSDMGDVKVEPHSDCVGCDDVVDLA